MPDLKKVLKSNLIEYIESERKKTDSLTSQLSAAGVKIVALEGDVRELKGKIDHMNYGHSQDLKADQKAVTELKMKIKTTSKIFDGINIAIDTVIAMKYPSHEIHYSQNPDDETLNLDDNFYMLKHFKRLMSNDDGVELSYAPGYRP